MLPVAKVHNLNLPGWRMALITSKYSGRNGATAARRTAPTLEVRSDTSPNLYAGRLMFACIGGYCGPMIPPKPFPTTRVMELAMGLMVFCMTLDLLCPLCVGVMKPPRALDLLGLLTMTRPGPLL